VEKPKIVAKTKRKSRQGDKCRYEKESKPSVSENREKRKIGGAEPPIMNEKPCSHVTKARRRWKKEGRGEKEGGWQKALINRKKRGRSKPGRNRL